MSGRKSKLFLALFALALNILSAPIAWARMSADLAHTPAHAMSGMEHCPGHMDATDSEKSPAPGTEHGSCCKGGPCNCGCLPAAAVTIPFIPRVFLAPQFDGATSVQAFPSKPFEDPLRPPIT